MIRHLHILDKTFILSLFICMTALSACNESMQINSFAQSEQIRIQVGGSTQMSYNPLTCQYVRNTCQHRAENQRGHSVDHPPGRIVKEKSHLRDHTA